MNKIITLMIAMLMSISLSSFAGTTTSTSANTKTEKVSVPANLIIKQTITFDDGKTIEVFYEKKGQNCKLYSTANINKYGITDLYRIKSTNFEKADHVEGKCYASRTVSALIAMARGILIHPCVSQIPTFPFPLQSRTEGCFGISLRGNVPATEE